MELKLHPLSNICGRKAAKYSLCDPAHAFRTSSQKEPVLTTRIGRINIGRSSAPAGQWTTPKSSFATGTGWNKDTVAPNPFQPNKQKDWFLVWATTQYWLENHACLQIPVQAQVNMTVWALFSLNGAQNQTELTWCIFEMKIALWSYPEITCIKAWYSDAASLSGIKHEALVIAWEQDDLLAL